MKILILGGTHEARQLAARLVEAGHEVVTSLAGRTSDPILPAGDLRVGKFGGIPGLVAYLGAARIERLVDATHPYAGLISINAVAASRQAGVPLIRLMRAPWPRPDGQAWTEVADMDEAASALASGANVLLTTGHAGLDIIGRRPDCHFIVRLIEAPQHPLPANADVLLDRPPFTVEGETALMRRHGITQLVSKNSGGTQTSAKLAAAEALGVGVIMVARPVYGPAHEVTTLDQALAALHAGTA